MHPRLLAPLAALVACQSPLSAALVWVDTANGGDGTSVFQELNWEDDTLPSPNTPPAGTVDGSVPIPASYGTIIMAEAAGNYGPYGPNFDLGGNTLLLSGGGNLVSSATNGLRSTDGTAGGVISTVIVSDTASIDVQFMLDLAVTLNGANTLRFRGGGNPINTTTIDINNPAASLLWAAETPANVISEHLGKITFAANPIILGADPAVAEPGDNAVLVDDGAAGAVMTFIPEPAAALFGTLGLLCLLRRKR